MGLDEFVRSHDVEIAEQRIGADEIKTVEQNIRRSLIGLLGDILTTEDIIWIPKRF